MCASHAGAPSPHFRAFSQTVQPTCSASSAPGDGLRKSAAVRLMEAGCSSKEVAAITGHASLREIERYTKAAEQEKLARQAVVPHSERVTLATCPNPLSGHAQVAVRRNAASVTFHRHSEMSAIHSVNRKPDLERFERGYFDAVPMAEISERVAIETDCVRKAWRWFAAFGSAVQEVNNDVPFGRSGSLPKNVGFIVPDQQTDPACEGVRNVVSDGF
jgi:hypothetical protein